MTIGLGRTRGSSQQDKAGKAVREIKRQVTRHTDREDVRISNSLNEAIWNRGAGRPPRRVEVQLIEAEDHIIADTPAHAAAQETAVDEEQLEAADEAAEAEAEEVSGQDEDEDIDIPADVKDVLKNGTIADGKEKVKELNKTDFEALIQFEKRHKNRKGMKKFLESNKR